MELLVSLILVFFIGIFTSFIGVIGGGGGLISIPFLIFIGLPPQIAVATNKCGSVGLITAAIPKFWKAEKIIWKYVLPFTGVSIVAAYFGANLLLSLDPGVLEPILGVMLLFILPFFLFEKELGTIRVKTNKLKKIIGFILYCLVLTYGSFIGAGSGVLIFYTLMFFFGFTILEANATNSIPWFVMSVTSLGIYAWYGIINWTYGLALFVGMYIGGYLGAHTAIKKGDTWVKTFFAFVVVCSALKLLLF